MKNKLMAVVVLFLVFLVGCKKESNLVIPAEKIDKVVISIKDDNGDERQWEARDVNFKKSVRGNLNLLFNPKDEDALVFDADLTHLEKEFEYKVFFYNEGEAVQEVNLIQGDKVIIDDTISTIKENKEKELNSLKSQLLQVVQ